MLEAPPVRRVGGLGSVSSKPLGGKSLLGLFKCTHMPLCTQACTCTPGTQSGTAEGARRLSEHADPSWCSRHASSLLRNSSDRVQRCETLHSRRTLPGTHGSSEDGICPSCHPDWAFTPLRTQHSLRSWEAGKQGQAGSPCSSQGQRMGPWTLCKCHVGPLRTCLLPP